MLVILLPRSLRRRRAEELRTPLLSSLLLLEYTILDRSVGRQRFASVAVGQIIHGEAYVDAIQWEEVGLKPEVVRLSRGPPITCHRATEGGLFSVL